MADYSSRIRQINSRYNPDNNLLVEQRSFSTIDGIDGDLRKYIKLAMNEVDEEYTAKTIEAGNRAKAHLQAEQFGIDYRFQGSVMTQTHIKGASDIDLLTLTNKFVSTDISKMRSILEKGAPNYTYTAQSRMQRYSDNFSRYGGDYMQDLRDLRRSDEIILKKRYTYCDINKAKAVHVYNTDLRRDVDVVASVWYDSVGYVINDKDETFRGVAIYNKEKDKEEPPSYPFLSIANINARSSLTGGRLKKMIRFLKNVRTDSDVKIDLSSFEINAVCYSIPIIEYKEMYYLDLVGLLWQKMYNMVENESLAKQLLSVDGTEYVFIKKPEKLPELKKLKDQVWYIYDALRK